MAEILTSSQNLGQSSTVTSEDSIDPNFNIPSSNPPQSVLSPSNASQSPSVDIQEISFASLPPVPQFNAPISPFMSQHLNMAGDYAQKPLSQQHQQFILQQRRVLLLQQQQKLMGTTNFSMQQSLQSQPLMPMIDQIRQLQKYGNVRQQAGNIYGQMNFGGSTSQPQQQQTRQHQNSQQSQLNQQQHYRQQQVNNQQLNQQAQNQQQLYQQLQPNQQAQNQQHQTGSNGGGGNLMRSALIGQSRQLPMLSSQAAQLNLQSQMMTMPRKSGLVLGTQIHTDNNLGQPIQGSQAMRMARLLNLNPQLRANEGLSYAQQRMNLGQMRHQMLQHNPLLSQGQNLSRTSSLAFTNAELAAIAQNGQQPSTIQNASSQQRQWSKQMPPMSAPVSSSYNLLQYQRHQQQLASSSQVHQNSIPLNSQQLAHMVRQQSPVPQQQQQPFLPRHHQQSSGLVGPATQKSLSLTGSHPNASVTTPGGSSSHGTEGTNQHLGKRKIQDLVSQVNPHATLDPDLQDLLLEIADNYIESVTAASSNLAKHRKSSTLESKDILLHLEKNLNLKVPGYSSEERKNQNKPLSNDLHTKRRKMVRSLMESSRSETGARNTKEMTSQLPGPQMLRQITMF